MNKITKIIIIFVALLFLVLLLIKSDVFGISGTNIEADARANHKISENWNAATSINEELAAVLFYDEASTSHVFSIYTKRDGLHFGYFFKYGGTSDVVSEGVQELMFRDKGSTLISMNENQVSRIDIVNNVNNFCIEIDPQKPFVVVLPADCGLIKLCDLNGNEIQKSVIRENA